MNSSGTLKIARNGYIVMAVIFCALGIFLMVNPTKAMKIICVLAGILFIADGIIKIIGYFSRDFYCLAFQFDLGFGILMIAIGILIIAVVTGVFGMILLIDPAGGAKMTVIFTGIGFLLEGILKLCVAVYTVKIRGNGDVVCEEEYQEIS